MGVNHSLIVAVVLASGCLHAVSPVLPDGPYFPFDPGPPRFPSTQPFESFGNVTLQVVEATRGIPSPRSNSLLDGTVDLVSRGLHGPAYLGISDGFLRRWYEWKSVGDRATWEDFHRESPAVTAAYLQAARAAGVANSSGEAAVAQHRFLDSESYLRVLNESPDTELTGLGSVSLVIIEADAWLAQPQRSVQSPTARCLKALDAAVAERLAAPTFEGQAFGSRVELYRNLRPHGMAMAERYNLTLGAVEFLLRAWEYAEIGRLVEAGPTADNATFQARWNELGNATDSAPKADAYVRASHLWHSVFASKHSSIRERPGERDGYGAFVAPLVVMQTNAVRDLAYSGADNCASPLRG